MSNIETIRINDHPFIKSRSARNMFKIEFELTPKKPNDYHKDLIVLATDITEVTRILNYPEFQSYLGKILNISDLGVCIDMDRVQNPTEPASRFKDIT